MVDKPDVFVQQQRLQSQTNKQMIKIKKKNNKTTSQKLKTQNELNLFIVGKIS